MLQRLRVPHTYCWSPALMPKPNDWVRLSAFAACTLANAGLLDLDDLKLFRPQEHYTHEGPWDPISGGFTAFVRAFGGMAMGLADVPSETWRALQMPAARSRHSPKHHRHRRPRAEVRPCLSWKDRIRRFHLDTVLGRAWSERTLLPLLLQSLPTSLVGQLDLRTCPGKTILAEVHPAVGLSLTPANNPTCSVRLACI